MHGAPEMPTALEIGEVAPPLVLTTLDGTSIDLAKLRGKVVLVNFWATWCAPCRKEMPTLDAFYRRHRGQDFELIGISIDFARDAARMRKVAARSPIRRPGSPISASMVSARRTACRSPM